MNAAEMVLLMDKYAELKIEGFSFGVQIIDVREVFGRVDCLVRPWPDGEGEQWVSRERLKVDFN